MARRVRRCIGAVLIVAALVLAVIPTEMISATQTYIDAFQMDHDELVKYTGTGASVSVSDSVKSIGQEAFANTYGLYNVELGMGAKVVKEGAFLNCQDLTTVTMHDNTEEIQSAAFAGCKNLKTFNIGGGLQTLGYGVFAGCDNLNSISISRNNTSFTTIGGALYDDTVSMLYGYLGGYQSTYYNMPDSVQNISKFAFWGNSKLDTVSCSSHLEKIPAYAFSNCKNLKEVNIPYSVTSIDAKAFENCISLYDVIIPASVSYIDPTAFDGCPHLNIIADEGTVAYDFFKNWDSSDVRMIETGDTQTLLQVIDNQQSGENTGVTGDDSSYNDSLNEVVPGIALVDASTDPSNVDYIPSSNVINTMDDTGVLAKSYVVGGRAVLFLSRNQSVVNSMTAVDSSDTNETLSGEEALMTGATTRDGEELSTDESETKQADDSSDSTTLYDPQKGGYLPKYSEINGKIAAQGYYGASDMAGYTMSEDITSIGDFAFARSNLTSITIPEGVTHIGYGAFYHCDSLNDVKIPSSVSSIEASAFDNTPYLNSFKSNVASDAYLVVGDGILLSYNGNATSVTIPSTVKNIGPNAFMNHTELTAVDIPDSVVTISDDAFRGCSNLKTINGGKNIESIGDRAFMNCPLDTIHIGRNVSTVGLRAFDFTDTDKIDGAKVAVFEGTHLPEISSGKTSERLGNYEYQKDALYNVLFAVVDESVDSFDGTVLDGDMLGFSGIILNLEKNSEGNPTGKANIKKSYIYSEEVLSILPEYVTIDGTNYSIEGIKKLVTSDSTRNAMSEDTNVRVLYNGEESKTAEAKFSETESVGVLRIDESETASSALNRTYSELFGGEDAGIVGFNISLKDVTETVPIVKFGQSILTVTMDIPKDLSGDNIRVVALDEDGQLEEINSSTENGRVSFECSHLSFYGMYEVKEGSAGLSLKNGRLVKNYKLDDSPHTGDDSIPIQYVIALLLLSSGLFLVLFKRSRRLVSD